MKTLKPRELTLLVSGVIVGLLLGMVLVSLDDDLALFGTAGGSGKSTADKDKETETLFYRIPLDQSQVWLGEVYPDLSPERSEELTQAFAKVAELPTAEDFFTVADETREVATTTVLPHFYAALSGVEVDKLDELDALEVNEGIVACLGLLDDPQRIGMYLYLKLSPDEAKQADLPEDWEEYKLDKPAENDLLWLGMGCYPDSEAEK